MKYFSYNFKTRTLRQGAEVVRFECGRVGVNYLLCLIQKVEKTKAVSHLLWQN